MAAQKLALVDRIGAPKLIRVSAERFQKMVRRKAYYFYEQRRRIRADLDWLAGQEMPRILWGRISRDEEVIRRFAYLAWEERQKTRALEDWLNAQRFLADIYVIEV